MAKKKLTATQKKRRYKLIAKATTGGEFVSIATPYVVMGAINFDEWFRTTEGWKVGLGGSLAIALLCITMISITKKKEDKDSSTGGYVSLLLSWLAIAFIFLLLANIMHDIASIMFFGAIGIAGALGLDITSKKYKIKADAYEKAIAKVDSEDIEEEVRKEKKIKIKIKEEE